MTGSNIAPKEGSYAHFVTSLTQAMQSLADGFDRLQQALEKKDLEEAVRYLAYLTISLQECAKTITENKGKIPEPMLEIGKQSQQIADIFDCGLAVLRSDMSKTMAGRYKEIAENFKKFEDMIAKGEDPSP